MKYVLERIQCKCHFWLNPVHALRGRSMDSFKGIDTFCRLSASVTRETTLVTVNLLFCTSGSWKLHLLKEERIHRVASLVSVSVLLKIWVQKFAFLIYKWFPSKDYTERVFMIPLHMSRYGRVMGGNLGIIFLVSIEITCSKRPYNSGLK